MLALLFSLICLLLGVVILTAGVTSNGRIVNAAKAEQAYFLVSSVFNEVDYETRVKHVDGGTETLEDFRFIFDVDNTAISRMIYGVNDYDELRLEAFRPYITSALKDAIVTGDDQERRFEITFGEELGADYTYIVEIDMSVKADDYSIYFNVTDILKDNAVINPDGTSSPESIGLPNLHTIAVEAKSVVPTEVKRTASGDVWKEIEFEYHRAKFVK